MKIKVGSEILRVRAREFNSEIDQIRYKKSGSIESV